MAPQTHTRYRVQRLIRLGEWLERNEAAFLTAFDAINDAHDAAIDSGEEDDPLSPEERLEHLTFQQMQPLLSMQRLVQELRFNVPTRDVKRGKDVTLHHPFACGEHEYEVVIEAPKPKLEVVDQPVHIPAEDK